MLSENETQIWLEKAKDDLEAAQAIINEKAPFWVACFHAQQAAEKALKAAQIYFLKDFHKEHDLEILLNSLAGKVDIDDIRHECIELTDFYVTTRYPEIKESELNLEDALSALKMAKKIVDFIIGKI